MSHQDVLKRMADTGSEFAKEMIRRRVERLKYVGQVNIKPEPPKPEIRTDEDIVNDLSTPIDEFFAAANRICRKQEQNERTEN